MRKDWADYAAEMFANDHQGEELTDVTEPLAEMLRCAERRRKGLLADIRKFVDSFYGPVVRRNYAVYKALNRRIEE